MPPRAALWAGILALIVAVSYANSLETPFVLDDPLHITKNPRIQRPLDIGSLFRDTRATVTASLRFNYSSSGLDVTSYHLLNVVAHLFTGYLVFLFSYVTLRLPSMGGRFERSADGIAAAVAAIFLLHPIQTESVTYVIQRSEIFASGALVAALLAFIDATDLRRRGALAGLAAACLFGAYSKPMFVVVPAVLAAYDFCFLSRNIRGMAERGIGYAIAIVSSILVLVLSTRSGSFSGTTAGFDVEGITPMQYLATQFGVVVYYLRVALWPDRLCFDCGYQGPWPVLASPLGDSVILPLAILLGLLVLGAALWRSYPPVLFAVLGSAFVLAPSSSIVPLADFYVEHRMYLAIGLMALALVPLAHQATATLGQRLGLQAESMKKGRLALAGAVCVVLGLLTLQRNTVYADKLVLMQDTLAKAPNSERVQYNIANEYGRRGQREKAIEHYKEAIRIAPGIVRSYMNLGSLYLKNNQVEEALQTFLGGVKAKPHNAMAHRNAGSAYLRLGKLQEGLASIERAIALDPGNANGHKLRGQALQALRRTDEAREAFRRASELNPGDADLKARLEQLGG
ncbi:MAG TPA: tetratricopeptide repeat protein [Candidatus Limnocylindrales bacterium]|nr:tetratricopeptide repeat protein [Candidatus Limnocylindrales bacterium]